MSALRLCIPDAAGGRGGYRRWMWFPYESSSGLIRDRCRVLAVSVEGPHWTCEGFSFYCREPVLFTKNIIGILKL